MFPDIRVYWYLFAGPTLAQRQITHEATELFFDRKNYELVPNITSLHLFDYLVLLSLDYHVLTP